MAAAGTSTAPRVSARRGVPAGSTTWPPRMNPAKALIASEAPRTAAFRSVPVFGASPRKPSAAEPAGGVHGPAASSSSAGLPNAPAFCAWTMRAGMAAPPRSRQPSRQALPISTRSIAEPVEAVRVSMGESSRNSTPVAAAMRYEGGAGAIVAAHGPTLAKVDSSTTVSTSMRSVPRLSPPRTEPSVCGPRGSTAREGCRYQRSHRVAMAWVSTTVIAIARPYQTRT